MILKLHRCQLFLWLTEAWLRVLFALTLQIKSLYFPIVWHGWKITTVRKNVSIRSMWAINMVLGFIFSQPI